MKFRLHGKKVRFILLFTLALCFSFLPALAQMPLLTDTPAPPEVRSPALTVTGGILIDHTSVELFDHIPENYLNAARDLRLMFSDRSVGSNINGSLNCLTAASWAQSLSYCRRDYYDSNWNSKTFTQRDLDAGLVPERIMFNPDPVIYNRSNWVYEFRIGEWQPLVSNFVLDLVPAYVNIVDVLSFQFSYLNIEEGSDIDDDDKGFFVDLPHYGYYPNGGERWDISDLEELEATYPDKVFFYWTASLARSIGSIDGTNFNNQMRQYAAEHDKILFDFADIESHTDLGLPCYDNRDGVQYCNMNGVCEDHPDDGLDIPAICQDYTSEVEGGHLGNVSGGQIRVAKAFWVLMARIAGWDGVVSTPDPSATLTQTVTPTSETTPTATHTVTATTTATPTQTVTATDTATVTQVNTLTPTATETPLPTATQTGTSTPTATTTGTVTASATATFTPTATNSATSTSTATATQTDTPTPTASETPSLTATQTGTSTSTATSTGTVTASATATFTPTATNTATSTSTATATQSDTPTPTASETPSLTATQTGTSTSTATSTGTVTASATATFTPTATNTATSTSTATATQTDTPTPTTTETPLPTATQTDTSTSTATSTGTVTASATATFTPTATNSATSTSTATATQTDTPTPTTTETPLPTATQTSTSTQTVTSTATPTASPTMTATVSPIFADGFESGDLSAWSASKTGGSDLSVTTAAAYFGSYGLQAAIRGGNALYVESDHPNAETQYSAGFYFDLNSIRMNLGDIHPIFQGFSGSTIVFQLDLGYSSFGYILQLTVADDSANLFSSDLLVIEDAYQNITLTWSAASSPGANGGTLALDVDAIPRIELVGIDNDTHRLDLVRLGALGGIERGTRGTYYFDGFESYR